MQETRVDPGVKTIPWRRGRQPLSVLAWGTPWTEGPGGLQSTGAQSRTQSCLKDFHWLPRVVCLGEAGVGVEDRLGAGEGTRQCLP